MRKQSVLTFLLHVRYSILKSVQKTEALMKKLMVIAGLLLVAILLVSVSCSRAVVEEEESVVVRPSTVAVSYTHLTLPTKRIV